jgi:hypothetical protein
MINNVKNVLTTIRENSKTEFKNILEETTIIAGKMDVDIRIPRVTKTQCHRANTKPQSTDFLNSTMLTIFYLIWIILCQN